MEHSHKPRTQMKKRISSATITSKKIRSILSSRQTRDQATITTIMRHKQPQHVASQHPAFKTSKTLTHSKGTHNTHTHTKSDQLIQRPLRQPNNNNNTYNNMSSMMDLISRTMKEKYEKTAQQSLLMRNCDRTKLVYWDSGLQIEGGQRFVVISADLVLDQDCFWEKGSGDKQQGLRSSNTLATLNHQQQHNYTQATSKSTTTRQPFPPKPFPSSSSHTIPYPSIPHPSQRPNPLLASNKLTSLIKQWKSLHSFKPHPTQKLIILWMVRKPSTYNHLLEFTQANQLPLHGAFYVKRRRGNGFFDANPVVREVYRRVMEGWGRGIERNRETEDKQGEGVGDNKGMRSIELNRRQLGTRPRQFTPNHTLSTTPHTTTTNPYHQFSQTTTCTQLPTTPSPITSLSTRITFTKKKLTQPTSNQQNNEPNLLNSQTCKGFQLSGKMREVRDERMVRGLLRRGNWVGEEEGNGDRNRASDSSRLQDTPHVQVNPSQQTPHHQPPHLPSITILQGIKLHPTHTPTLPTYHGKLPILFSHHSQRFTKVMRQIHQQQKGKEGRCQLEVEERREAGKEEQVRMGYVRYDGLGQNPLEMVGRVVRGMMVMEKECMEQHQYQKDEQLHCFHPSPTIHQFSSHLISQTLSQPTTYPPTQQNQQRPQSPSSSPQSTQPTQHQQQQIHLLTQKKIQLHKRQAIDHIIALKGRGYTFENGQSIYYFVGDAFKRNYDLLYGECYAGVEREVMGVERGGGKGGRGGEGGRGDIRGRGGRVDSGKGRDVSSGKGREVSTRTASTNNINTNNNNNTNTNHQELHLSQSIQFYEVR